MNFAYVIFTPMSNELRSLHQSSGTVQFTPHSQLDEYSEICF
ncbi:MAG: hypothetical protein V7K50_17715 [Nostoc sp.]